MSVMLMAAMLAAGDANVVKCTVAKLPKGELAALAEREIVPTGWLPEPLR